MESANRTGRLVAEPIRTSADLRRCREVLVNRGDAQGLLLFLCGTHSTLTVDRLLTLPKSSVAINGQTMSITSGRGKFELLDADVRFKLYSTHKSLSACNAPSSESSLIRRHLAQLPDDAPLFSKVFSSRGVREFVQDLTSKIGIKPLDKRNCFSGETLRKSFGYMLATKEKVALSDLRKMFGKLTLAETQRYLCIPDEDFKKPTQIFEW